VQGEGGCGLGKKAEGRVADTIVVRKVYARAGGGGKWIGCPGGKDESLSDALGALRDRTI